MKPLNYPDSNFLYYSDSRDLSGSVVRRTNVVVVNSVNKEGIEMLQQLKKWNKDGINDLDETIALSAFAKGLQAEYVTRNIPVPEWLTTVLTTLGHEITSKTRDQLEKRKRELLAQKAGLESAEDKRARIAKELAEIGAQLGEPAELATK